MRKTAIQLPDGDNIETLQLTRLIAEALLPRLENCVGIECVMGMKKTTQSGDVFPFKLSKNDRDHLETLLEALPKVRADMSSAELQAFQDAYQALPNKSDGEPYFATQYDIAQRNSSREELEVTQQDALRQEVKMGSIAAYDALHRPAYSLGFGVFISRSDALKYLRKINLGYEFSADRHTTTNDEPEGTGEQYVPLDQVKTKSRITDQDRQDSKSVEMESSNSVDAQPSISSSRIHRLDDGEIPFLSKRMNRMGKLAVKAAWTLQNESGRLVHHKEVFNRLASWALEDSAEAEGLLVGYDPEKQVLKWRVNSKSAGKPYDLRGCQRHVSTWQKTCKEGLKK